MWWDKKPQAMAIKNPGLVSPPLATHPLGNLVTDNQAASISTMPDQNRTVLGPSMVLHGELSGSEDLLIEGQFEGIISLRDHCLTVGSQGQLKAEIHARQVVVLGSVNGNILAREKIEIRKTGHVVGDLVAAGIAIEEGAYFKGSIDIQREESQVAPRPLSTPNALKTSA